MSNKPGTFGNKTSRQATNGSDGMGLVILDPPPRLISIGRGNKEDRLRQELNGDIQRAAKAKISLPTLKFLKDEDA